MAVVLKALRAAALLAILAGCKMPHTQSAEQPSIQPADAQPSHPDEPGPTSAPTTEPEQPISAPTPKTGEDRRSVTVQPAELNVLEGASAKYTVVLGSRPSAPVTVTAAAPAELSAAPETLVFTRAHWRAAQTVTVTAAEDDDAVADDPAPLAHTASGGDYEGTPVAPLMVTIVEDDISSLAVGGERAPEGVAVLTFDVSLSLANDDPVTVHYRTGAPRDTAAAGSDYARASGTLTFPAGSAAARAIEVTVVNDALDEPDEEFTVTLSRAQHAVLAGGGATLAATGTIADDDEPPELNIAGGSVSEGAGAMRFAVRLDRASGRTVTVRYASADETAAAGEDYTAASGTLTFVAGTTERAIAVPILADAVDEGSETFTVTLSEPGGATLAAATAVGTITDAVTVIIQGSSPLKLLSSLQVTGGGTMYPAFDGGVHYYALTCEDSTTLQVTARASSSGAQLTLLRADHDDQVSTAGSLDARVTVSGDHDIAIRVRDAGDPTTYVIHCIPPSFPHITILKKTSDVAHGLMLIVPRWRRYSASEGRAVAEAYMAIIDNNGVPRFHRHIAFLPRDFSIGDGHGRAGGNFRRLATGGYSLNRNITQRKVVELYDNHLQFIKSIGVVGPLQTTDLHDFLITEEGNYLFISYHYSDRDLCELQRFYCADGTQSISNISDSVIQEVTPDGSVVFTWNSWDHMNVSECMLYRENDYAHLNSLYLVDGDIIASFRNCSQVLRIDRSTATGSVEWQIGGTSPPRHPATKYLEIVGDSSGQNEICAQHQVTITRSGHVLMFDNGNLCHGARRRAPQFTRIVEFDISSATQAVFSREFVLPVEHGISHINGGVTEMSNGNWLISFGPYHDSTLPSDRRWSVVEVDPDAGTTVLELNMYAADAGKEALTYRVFREPESSIAIPLHLP